MSFRTTLVSLTFLFGLTSSPVTAESLDLSKISGVKSQHSCFHAIFSSYDSWFNWLYSKREANFQRRGLKDYSMQLKKFEQGFKSMFSKEDFDAAQNSLDCQNFKYEVNDQEVEGVLITPKDLRTKQSDVPVVLYNRGGTRGLGDLRFGHIAYELFPIALQGYAIIASNYRKDEQYGADNIDEVTYLVDMLQQLPNLQSDKLNLYGISRGGLTSMQLAKARPDKIASITSVNGVMNSELWAKNNDGIQNNLSLIKGFKQNKKALHHKLSPVQWVDALPEVPILLVHSEDDERVSAQHTLQFAQKLKEKNRSYKLLTYPDGGHSLGIHKRDSQEQIAQWMGFIVK